jgi:hypothetical protein
MEQKDEEYVWEKLKGTMWNYIEKHHMEEMCREKISDDEWDLFLEAFQDGFADEVSQLAVEYWEKRKEHWAF